MLKTVVTNPYSFLALALMGLAAGGFIFWFGADLMTLTLAPGLGLALWIGWLVMLARSDAFRVADSLERTADAAGDIAGLAKELAKFGLAQGVEQLRAIHERHENLATILKHRLNEGEIAYGRYIGLAEQVYLSVIEQLREAAITAQAMSRIDLEAETKRLQTLKLEKGDPGEILAIEQRVDLVKEQKARLSRMLTLNESAVTVFDRTTAALASTKTAAGVDAQTAIKDLEEMAARTNTYAAR